MLLKVATEMRFPEDAMKKTVALWRAPLKDARELRTVGPREESPPPPRAPLPAEDAERRLLSASGLGQGPRC